MKQGLSKREKILIFSAALIALFYLAIQFAILPLISRYNIGIAERDRLAAEKSAVEFDISSRPIIENQNQTAIERFEEIKQEYPLLIPNEEIVNTLTDLCLRNGLRPTMLNIVPPDAPRRGSNQPETPVSPLFTVITANMNVTGAYSSLLNLLDEVESLQYMRITNLGYSAGRRADSESEDSITLTFELTYINPQ